MRYGVLMLSLYAGLAVAAGERFSIAFTGGYTELDGTVDLQSIVTPFVLSNPFDPLVPLVRGDPIEVGTPTPFDGEDVSWEISMGYRVVSWLQIQGGYVDFGSFDSVTASVAFVAAPIGVPLGPVFGGVPPGGFAAIAQPLPSLSTISFKPTAWFLGAKADHPITAKTKVYARFAPLRASFETKDTFGDFLDVQDPSDKTGWLWGVGVQYAVLPRLLIGAGYTQYDVKLQKFDSYQLSLEFIAF